MINLRDTRGVLPAGAIYVGRAMPRYRLAQSDWANPFRIGPDGDRHEVLAKYMLRLVGLIAGDPERYRLRLLGLRGHDCGCWCWPERCHAEPLVKWSNEDQVLDPVAFRAPFQRLRPDVAHYFRRMGRAM